MATSKTHTPNGTASYIEQMLNDLRAMSSRVDAHFLTYLIEMAMIEANRLSTETKPVSDARAFDRDMRAEQLAQQYLAGELD